MASAFILEPVGPRDDPPCREQVLAAYQDRMGARGIRRTFGVCYQTLLRWLGEKREAPPAFADTRLPGTEGDVLELDALWSFVNRKAQTLWRWVFALAPTKLQRSSSSSPSPFWPGKSVSVNAARPTISFPRPAQQRLVANPEGAGDPARAHPVLIGGERVMWPPQLRRVIGDQAPHRWQATRR